MVTCNKCKGDNITYLQTVDVDGGMAGRISFVRYQCADCGNVFVQRTRHDELVIKLDAQVQKVKRRRRGGDNAAA